MEADKASPKRLPHYRLTGMLDTYEDADDTRVFHRPGRVNALRPGQKVLVTDSGQPKFTVTKEASRPIKRRADLEREARELCPKDGPKLNFTAFLRFIR